MKKPKPPEQVYREHLAKDTGYRKVDNLPACCAARAVTTTKTVAMAPATSARSTTATSSPTTSATFTTALMLHSRRSRHERRQDR